MKKQINNRIDQVIHLLNVKNTIARYADDQGIKNLNLLYMKRKNRKFTSAKSREQVFSNILEKINHA